jgi:hypothetical protein
LHATHGRLGQLAEVTLQPPTSAVILDAPRFCPLTASLPLLLLQYKQASPGYGRLASLLQPFEAKLAGRPPIGRLFYLALPPFLYPEVRGCCCCCCC